MRPGKRSLKVDALIERIAALHPSSREDLSHYAMVDNVGAETPVDGAVEADVPPVPPRIDRPPDVP